MPGSKKKKSKETKFGRRFLKEMGEVYKSFKEEGKKHDVHIEYDEPAFIEAFATVALVGDPLKYVLNNIKPSSEFEKDILNFIDNLRETFFEKLPKKVSKSLRQKIYDVTRKYGPGIRINDIKMENLVLSSLESAKTTSSDGSPQQKQDSHVERLKKWRNKQNNSKKAEGQSRIPSDGLSWD